MKNGALLTAMLAAAVLWLLLLMMLSHHRGRHAARIHQHPQQHSIASPKRDNVAEYDAASLRLVEEIEALLAELRLVEEGLARSLEGDKTTKSVASLEREAHDLQTQLVSCRRMQNGDDASILLDPAEVEQRRISKYQADLRNKMIQDRTARKVPQNPRL